MFHPADDRHARRPWSPEYVGATSSFAPRVGRHHTRQREPSDNSVEDIDLTDYALELRRADGPYALVNSDLRAATMTSRTVPSLIHGPSTAPSSQSHGFSSPPRSPIPIPARMQPLYPPTYPPIPHSILPSSGRARSPLAHDDTRYEFSGLEDDPDVSKFPPWSRRWFEEEQAGRGIERHSIPERDLGFDPYGLDRFYDRQLLPWSGQQSGSATVTPETKNDRIKLLEREFAPLQSGRRGRVEESEHNVGSIDDRGHLITDGPRKRTFFRVVQGLMVLMAGGVSIYGALFIKLKVPTKPPPPMGRFSTYALYVLSVITFLAVCYFFLIRPCCCAGKREDKENNMYTGAPGMMVLPVQSMGRNTKKKKKAGKKNKGMPTPGDVQVNLIVDPSMFGRSQEPEEEDSDQQSEREDRRRRPNRRRGFMQGMAMEAAWNLERSRLKKQLAFDLVFMTLWAVQFVLIMLGPRCPPGGFEGWCNAFNTATAAACFLAFAFATSTYFDIRDLHASKISPRSRT